VQALYFLLQLRHFRLVIVDERLDLVLSLGQSLAQFFVIGVGSRVWRRVFLITICSWSYSRFSWMTGRWTVL
jgi:hypothetical protein